MPRREGAPAQRTLIALPEREIELESCSIGDCQYAPFMTNRYVQARLKNRTALPMAVRRITCWFDSDSGLASQQYSNVAPLDITPGGRTDAVIIPFTVDLNLRESTNYAHIEVDYAVGDGRDKLASFGMPDTGYMIVLPTDAQPKRQFFISYKIPADTATARDLRKCLAKAGIRGYIAEDDPRYGHNMYTGKFEPEIDNSEALVVLWTKSASADPGTMQWEMEYSQKKSKRIYVVKEDGVDPPPGLPESTERFHAGSPVSGADLVDFTAKIYCAYQQGID